MTREAQEYADSVGVEIFRADIIYHLFDQFRAYMERVKEEKRTAAAEEAVFPCRLSILPEYVFNQRDPIILGVEIVDGVLRKGTPICVPGKGFITLGKVASIEKEKREVFQGRRGDQVSIKRAGAGQARRLRGGTEGSRSAGGGPGHTGGMRRAARASHVRHCMRAGGHQDPPLQRRRAGAVLRAALHARGRARVAHQQALHRPAQGELQASAGQPHRATLGTSPGVLPMPSPCSQLWALGLAQGSARGRGLEARGQAQEGLLNRVKQAGLTLTSSRLF